MKHRGKTPPFHTPNGEILPGSIAEIDYLHLGGIDQWVMIRGETVTNPVLVLLHGGPGFPVSSVQCGTGAVVVLRHQSFSERGLWFQTSHNRTEL